MERNKKIIQISIIGILVNLILVAFKAFVGIVTGSVAVTMDAVNNLSDALSSVITIIGTKLAGKAPLRLRSNRIYQFCYHCNYYSACGNNII